MSSTMSTSRISATMLGHIDDPIGFVVRLDAGDVYELAIDRAENPVPVPTEQ